MKSSMKTVLVGVSISAVVTIAVTVGFFAFPNPVGTIHADTNNFCQKSLDFGRFETSFIFSYKNLGSDIGVFEGSITSNEVLSKYKNTNQPFKLKSSQAWVTEKGQNQSFEFVLSLPETNEPETISIETNLSCKKSIANSLYLPCGNIKQVCTYQNQHVEHFGPDYELIS